MKKEIIDEHLVRRKKKRWFRVLRYNYLTVIPLLFYSRLSLLVWAVLTALIVLFRYYLINYVFS